MDFTRNNNKRRFGQCSNWFIGKYCVNLGRKAFKRDTRTKAWDQFSKPEPDQDWKINIINTRNRRGCYIWGFCTANQSDHSGHHLIYEQTCNSHPQIKTMIYLARNSLCQAATLLSMAHAQPGQHQNSDPTSARWAETFTFGPVSPEGIFTRVTR